MKYKSVIDYFLSTVFFLIFDFFLLTLDLSFLVLRPEHRVKANQIAKER